MTTFQKWTTIQEKNAKHVMLECMNVSINQLLLDFRLFLTKCVIAAFVLSFAWGIGWTYSWWGPLLDLWGQLWGEGQELDMFDWSSEFTLVTLVRTLTSTHESFPSRESHQNEPWAAKRELSCRSQSLHWGRNVSEGGGWERWRYRRDSGNQTPDPHLPPLCWGPSATKETVDGGRVSPLIPHTHTEWQLRLGQQSTLWHSSSEGHMGVSAHLVFGCVAY